jgi:hypothetical protein
MYMEAFRNNHDILASGVGLYAKLLEIIMIFSPSGGA